MHSGWATRTRKSSAVCNVKGEATFWALHQTFLLRIHSLLSSLSQSLNKILKTFLKGFNKFYAEILTTLKTIKYPVWKI
jgi:hypothetical protein